MLGDERVHARAERVLVGRAAHDRLGRAKALARRERPVEHEVVDAREHAGAPRLVALDDLLVVTRIDEVEPIRLGAFQEQEGVALVRGRAALGVVDKDPPPDTPLRLVPLSAPRAVEGHDLIARARKVELRAHQPAHAQRLSGIVGNARGDGDDVAVPEHGTEYVQTDLLRRVRIAQFERFPLAIGCGQVGKFGLFRVYLRAGEGKARGKAAVRIFEQNAVLGIVVRAGRGKKAPPERGDCGKGIPRGQPCPVVQDLRGVCL